MQFLPILRSFIGSNVLQMLQLDFGKLYSSLINSVLTDNFAKCLPQFSLERRVSRGRWAQRFTFSATVNISDCWSTGFENVVSIWFLIYEKIAFILPRSAPVPALAGLS